MKIVLKRVGDTIVEHQYYPPLRRRKRKILKEKLSREDKVGRERERLYYEPRRLETIGTSGGKGTWDSDSTPYII